MTDQNEYGRQIRYVKEWKIHQTWNSRSENYGGDIALIRLNSPVYVDYYVRPICLMTTTQDIADGKVASWTVKTIGSTANSDDDDDVNKLYAMKITKLQQCLVNYPVLKRYSWSNSFCAKKKDTDNICSSETGHGLFVEIESRIYLKGFSSAGKLDYQSRSCSNNYDTLFTDIPKYFDFIKV